MEVTGEDKMTTTTKVLDIAALKEFKKEVDRTGIVYLSRIPPLMGPQDLRNHLSPFGEITRVYLTPAGILFAL